jgi:ubiquinone/menaquinone biosynthesis C-methylase UbiE
MVDLKNYDEELDFFHHKKEFDLFNETMQKHASMNDAVVLDFCTGLGKHIGFIANLKVKYTIGLDIIDYQTIKKGLFKNYIYDYFSKYNYSVDTSRIDLIRSDAQKTAIKDSSIDIIVSFNAFEHIPDPELALLEIFRLLKPGGYTFISFIPVFHSDVGSHMSSFINEPWAHLVYSEDEFLQQLIDITGGNSFWGDEFKFGLNKLSKQYYINLFSKYCKNFNELSNIISNSSAIGNINNRYSNENLYENFLFSALEYHEWIGVEDENSLNHRNFKILQTKFSKEELLFRGAYMVLQKNP